MKRAIALVLPGLVALVITSLPCLAQEDGRSESLDNGRGEVRQPTPPVTPTREEVLSTTSPENYSESDHEKARITTFGNA